MFLTRPTIDLGNPVSDDPLCRGLVAWWMGLPNNSNGKTLFDLTGHNNNGTLTNMAMAGTTSGWRPNTRPGNVGPVIAYDGTDDSVACGSKAALTANSSSFTYACWFRCGSAGATFFPLMGFNGSSYTGLMIVGTSVSFTSTAHTLNSAVYIGGYKPASGSIVVDDDTWHHAAMVYDRAAQTLTQYVDGRADGSASTTGQIGTEADAMSFGTVAGFGRFLAGSLDDAAVWSRVLSASEVFAVYADGLAGHPRMLRRCKRRVVAQFGNRRRRVLICGGSN